MVRLTLECFLQTLHPVQVALGKFGHWLRSTLCSCCGPPRHITREVETEPLLE